MVLISIPFLARLAGVDAFGQYTEFLSFTLVIQLLGSLRIETIFLSKERNKLTDNQILSSLCFFSLILTLVLSLISYTYFQQKALIILLFISSYGGNLASIFTLYSLANNQVYKVTMFRILRPILLAGCQLFIMCSTLIDNPLEIGYTCSMVCSALIVFKIFGYFSLLSFKNILVMLREGRKYIMYSFPSDALNSFGSQLPILLFANYFGTDTAAYYYTANKTIIAPYALVTESLSKINMQIFKREPLRVFLVYLRDLQAVQVVLFLSSYTILLLFSDEIALFFFGESSDAFTFIMCAAFPLSFAVFIGVPVLALLSVSSRQQVDLIFQIVLFVARLIGISLGFYFSSFVASLVGYFLLSSIVYIVFAHKSGLDIGHDSRKRLYTVFSIMMVLVVLKLFVFDSSFVLRVLMLIGCLFFIVYGVIKFFFLEATNN